MIFIDFPSESAISLLFVPLFLQELFLAPGADVSPTALVRELRGRGPKVSSVGWKFTAS